MSTSQDVGLVASVRQRLLNLSRDRGEDFNLTLNRYASERFLYRLTQSAYADHFVLKGAMLFALWSDRLYRATRDLDLLGYGDRSPGTLVSLFGEVCTVEVCPDGLAFNPDSIRVAEIREVDQYQSHRVQLVARLGSARIPLQIDIGFGDVVTPAAQEARYPTMLDFPAPRVRVYPWETVVAERLQAMVALGIVNSRMKDFYDLWMISREFTFDGELLAQAIASTFRHRRAELPQTAPVALTAQFAQQPNKGRQWSAFLSRSGLATSNAELAHVIDDLGRFLMPVLSALAREEDFDVRWPAGGPWVS